MRNMFPVVFFVLSISKILVHLYGGTEVDAKKGNRYSQTDKKFSHISFKSSVEVEQIVPSRKSVSELIASSRNLCAAFIGIKLTVLKNQSGVCFPNAYL